MNNREKKKSNGETTEKVNIGGGGVVCDGRGSPHRKYSQRERGDMRSGSYMLPGRCCCPSFEVGHCAPSALLNMYCFIRG